MVLNNLVIQGFKSFPDKTKIDFHHGLTAVVGPNGSGKSNISDAIRWVMGEQSSKTLRSGKMEDVIFSGTKNRKAMTFAEVSLSIDNHDRSLAIDADEVIITRRYSRSGDSEYRINQQSVRLKDINELFMDTGLGKDGYAMVGQGRIDEIVRSKSDERRLIFEEAAGISKFRTRKADAERRLTAAEDNLVRLRDILQELTDRLGPLQHQAEKAKRYLELAGQRKTLEISVWMHQLSVYQHQMKDIQDRMMARRMELEETEEQIQTLNDQIERAYQTMNDATARLDADRRTQEETRTEVSKSQAQAAVLENDLTHLAEEQERLKRERQTLLQNQAGFAFSISEQEAQLDQMDAVLREISAKVEAEEAQIAQMEQEQAKADSVHSETEQQISALVVRQSVVENNLSSLDVQQAEDEKTAQGYDSQLQAQQDCVQKSEAELQQNKRFLGTLQERITGLTNMTNGYERRLQSKQEEFRKARDAEADLQMKIRETAHQAQVLEDLEKNMDGYSFSVKSVMKHAKSGALRGIDGTISQLVDVSEEYTVAIETALGFAQQNIVVETDRDAKSAIRFLQEQKSGRATFLPLNAVRGGTLQNRELREELGYVALASELVTFDERYRPAIEYLLGRIAVCEDMDAATAIARKYQYKFRIVTLDGQVINAGGSMTGGSQNKTGNFVSRKADVQQLHKKIEGYRKSVKQQAAQTARLEEEYQKARAEKRALEAEVLTVREDLIRAEGEVRRLEQQTAADQELLRRMELENEQFAKRQELLSMQKASLQEELSSIQEKLQSHRAAFETFEQQAMEAKQQVREHQEALSALRFSRLEQEKNKEAGEHLLQELRLRGTELEQRKEELDEALCQQERRRKELSDMRQGVQAMIDRLTASLEQLKEEMERLQALHRETEGNITEYRREERNSSVRAERLRQEVDRFDERFRSAQKNYDDLIRKLWEEYELTRGEAEDLAQPIENFQETERELQSLRAKIRALGSVNVEAVEEYQEVSKRHRFLNEQVNDAEKARAELLRMIGELTNEMQTLFLDSFRRINTHFQQIFVELFGGGRAELRLTDPEDLLGCGIEIVVEPPGKIIRSLTALSGGEQAFVAMALYFAILHVRPAPFCVLDEIEAALDDVNVSKYAAYIRKLTANTQFISITHRRGTMEEADTLYGVTMQQEGVSKLLQLKVSEIEQTMAALGN